ncbi:WD40-repeat-containing domain protein [Lipomyces orientalis]|uniref:WD40-repeat-containing domain protein n=1 Tax=Lipomyces orientalis TaxID=1233043 RepID=A0ACC3TDP4_9ASCO
MEQRRAEIEAKKAKLADLRRQRQDRLQMPQHSLSRDALSPSRGAADRRSDIDQLVASLVGSPRSQSRLERDSVASSGQENSDPFVDTAPYSPRKAPTTPPFSDLSTAIITLFDAPPLAQTQLRDSEVRVTEEKITYSKEVQTAESWITEEPQYEYAHLDVLSASDPGEFQEKVRERLRREIEEELWPQQKRDSPNVECEPSAARSINMKDLRPEEKSELLQSEEFLQFIERSSKIVERVLDDDYDILVDYASGFEDKEYVRIPYFSGSQSEGMVKQVTQFFSDRWSSNRTITAIDWSPKYVELLLAAYSKTPQSTRDPMGIIQVWNAHLHDRPEYIFHSQSDILSSKFSPFHPNLIVGGCYNGQILVWDTRAKYEAILKSPLTGTGHTHPVYSIEFVGTKNATNIISCSTDGRVCEWNADFLALPHASGSLAVSVRLVYDFKLPPPSRTEDLAPTVLGLQVSDPSYFLVGSEDGDLYTCNRSVGAGAKAGLDLSTTYRSHAAPVSGLSFHPTYGPLDLSDLVLSSSLDWTLKLWRVRKSTKPTMSTSRSGIIGVASVETPNLSSASHTSIMNEPLMEFSADDAVFDVAWNPVRPAVFASVGCAGKVDIWDLLAETEVPLASSRPTTASGAKCQALNKVAWEKSDGKRLAVGGLSSVVTVFEVGDSLGGAANARSEEWRHMRRLVAYAEKRTSKTDAR